MEWFYKGLSGVLLLLYLVIISKYLRKYKRQEDGIELNTPIRRSAFVLLILTLLGFTVPQALYVSSDLLDWANVSISTVVRFVGLFIYQLGLALFFISKDNFDDNWWSGPEIGHNPHLAKETVYGYMRHPIYTSVYTVMLGCTLVAGNWLIGVCALVPFTALCVVRIPIEEEVLKRKMGSSYAEYKKATGFLFPKLFGRK